MTELEYSEFLKSETDLERESKLYLEHYGVKGMRWGVRRTPEQLGHKTKKTGVVSGIVSAVKKKSAATKKVKAKKKAAAAKKKEKKQEESADKIREKLLTSTDPKYIYQYRSLLDDKELQGRIDRIMKENKIKELIPDPSAKRQKQMKKGEDFLKSLGNMADSAVKVYTAYDKIFGDGGNKQKAITPDKKDDEKPKESKEEKKLYDTMVKQGILTADQRKDIGNHNWAYSNSSGLISDTTPSSEKKKKKK